MEDIEKEYKEWCVNLLKVRFDLKDEYYDPHQHNNFTYENCANCLWNYIKNELEYLHYLRYSLGDNNNDVIESPEEIKENRDELINFISTLMDYNINIQNKLNDDLMVEYKKKNSLEFENKQLKNELEHLRSQLNSTLGLLYKYRKITMSEFEGNNNGIF